MKLLSTTLAIIAALGLLAFTNPKMEQYEEYLHQRVVQRTEKQDDVSKAVGAIFGRVAGSLLASATVRKDYVFLSVYDTRFGGERLKVVGVLNNFILLEDAKSAHRQ